MKSSINLQRLQEKLRLENERKEKNIRLLTRPTFNAFRYKLAQENLISAMNDMGESERCAYITLLIKSSNALEHLSLIDATITSFAKIIKSHPVPQTPYSLRKGTRVTDDDMKFILQELMNMGLVKEINQRNSLRYGMTEKIFHINNLSDPESENTLIAPTEADLEIEMIKKILYKRAEGKASSKETEQIEEYLKNRPLKRKKTAKEIHDSGECDKSTCRLCSIEQAKETDQKEESLENLSSQEDFQYIPASSLTDELSSTESKDLYTQCPICGTDFKGKSLKEMEEHGKTCI